MNQCREYTNCYIHAPVIIMANVIHEMSDYNYILSRQNLRDSFSPFAGSFSPSNRSQVIQVFDQLEWTPEQVQALENNLYSTSELQDNFCYHPAARDVSKK